MRADGPRGMKDAFFFYAHGPTKGKNINSGETLLFIEAE